MAKEIPSLLTTVPSYPDDAWDHLSDFVKELLDYLNEKQPDIYTGLSFNIVNGFLTFYVTFPPKFWRGVILPQMKYMAKKWNLRLEYEHHEKQTKVAFDLRRLTSRGDFAVGINI